MKKWFSLALTMALCLTMLSGGVPAVFAEEETVISEPVDPQYADTETDLVELPDDGGEDGGLQIEAEEVEALEIDASEAVEASLEDISTGDDAPADQDSFVPWYAAALASLTLEMDEVVSCNIPEGSVLLVTGQPGEGLLNVACGALTGVVDATALTALTEDEVLAFMDQVALMEEIALYQDMPEYPLPPVPAQQADAPEVGEAVPGDANPEDAAAGDEDPDFTEPTDDNADDADDEEVPEDQQGTEEPADAENKEEAEEPADAEKKEDAGESEDGEKKEDAEESEDGKKKEDVEEPAEGEAAQSAEESAAAVEKASAEADGKTENKESAEATGSANAATATDAAAGAAAPASEAGVPASIAVNLSAVNLGLKEKFSGLTAAVVDAAGTPVEGAAVNWASSNVRVVRVDAAGKLTAVRKGKATVVIRAEGLPEALVTVIVKSAPSKVTLKPKKVHVSVGTPFRRVFSTRSPLSGVSLILMLRSPNSLLSTDENSPQSTCRPQPSASPGPSGGVSHSSEPPSPCDAPSAGYRYSHPCTIVRSDG